MDFDKIALTDSQLKLLGEFYDTKSIQFRPETDRYADARRLEYYGFVSIAKSTYTASIKDYGRDYYMWIKGTNAARSRENRRWWANFAVSVIAIILSVIAIIASVKSKQVIEIINHIDYPESGYGIFHDDSDPLDGSKEVGNDALDPNPPIANSTP